MINTKAAAEDAKYIKDFFNTVGDRIIEQNYQGKLIHFVPDVSSVLPGRRALADLEFMNRDEKAHPIYGRHQISCLNGKQDWPGVPGLSWAFE